MKSLSRSGDKSPVTVSESEAKAQESHPVADPEHLRSSYLNRLVQVTRKLYLSGIDTRAISCEADECLNLDAVYTSLLTHSVEKEELRLSDSPEKAVRLSALTLLDRHSRLVLLGYPGSGKSTFVNFVALCLAGERLNNEVAHLSRLTSPLPDDEGKETEERQPWSHGALIPVLIVLRDFAARGLSERAWDKSVLWHFIESELRSAMLGGFAPHLYKELMEQGGLILLDGLDEVSEADRCREQIKASVEEFAATFHTCRIVVTSRTYAYQKQSWRLSGFAEAELAFVRICRSRAGVF
jgi:predicted NACHT family NTPase